MYYYSMRKNIFLFSCLISSTAIATTSAFYPSELGVSISGLYGDISSGQADALIPVLGQATSFLFVDPQVFYHNSSEYSSSLGLGYRALNEKWGILGAYVFADYNHSMQNNSFWFLSPGIQRLGDSVDFDANLYLPISAKHKDTGLVFADEIGIDDFVTFSGHDQIDQLVETFESTGPGVDAEVAYRLPGLKNNTKLYVGGYYFNPKDNNSIRGITAHADIPINKHLNFVVSEAYDNVAHNTVKIGLSLSLGGRSSGFDYSGDLNQRMVDPIDRNVAAISGSSHTIQPVEQGYALTNEYAVEMSNIWFISPNGSLGTNGESSEINYNSCTATAPCSLTQDNIDDINTISPNANLYLESGQYTDISSTGALTLDDGQSIFGRSLGFTSSANTNNLPTLFGALNLTGNNYIELIKLMNDGQQTAGINLLDDANNVAINEVVVGTDSSDPDSTHRYETGIQINNNDSLWLTNSIINAYGSNATGIFVDGNYNSVNLMHNIITAGDAEPISLVVGMEVVGNNNLLQLVQNQITATSTITSTAGTGFEEADSFGLILQGNQNILNLSYNQITANASASAVDSHFGEIFGFGVVVNGNQNTVNMWQNNIIGTATISATSDTAMVQAGGVDIEGNQNNINLWNNEIRSQITDNAIDSNVGEIYSVGLLVFGSEDTINMQYNNISAETVASFTTGYASVTNVGVQLDGEKNSVNMKSNTITANASTTSSTSPSASSSVEVIGLSVYGNNNTFNMSFDSITANSQGNPSEAFPPAVAMEVGGSNQKFDLNYEQLVATSTNDVGGAAGFLTHSTGDSYNIQNTLISASTTGSGIDSNAYGVLSIGNANTITLQNSLIMANAMGTGADAYGISAYYASTIFSMSAENSSFNLMNDQIIATSLQNNAYGLFDNFNGTGSTPDSWNIDMATLKQILATAAGEACITKFNGVCLT